MMDLKQIYDNKLPYLNDELDTNLKENTKITCLIVRNKLNETKYKNEKFTKKDFLQLSLKNTLINNAKQYFIPNYLNLLNMPFILGISYTSEKGKWIDNKNIIKDSLYNNESILQNIINELEINQFGNFEKNKNNLITGFSYERFNIILYRIRKGQNYEWADEYIKKGVDAINVNIEKAIEYFKDAEKLDQLNKEIYVHRGMCYLQMVYSNK